MREQNSLNITIKSLTETIRKPTTSRTTKDLIHFIGEFENLHDIRDEITIYFKDDQLQGTELDTCGIVQLFIYKNLFAHDYKSAIAKLGFHCELT